MKINTTHRIITQYSPKPKPKLRIIRSIIKDYQGTTYIQNVYRRGVDTKPKSKKII